MRPLLTPILAASLLAAAPALAQDRPANLTPTRDVAVTYRLAGAPAGAETMRIAFLAADGLVRTEMPGGLGWGVMNHRTGEGFVVMEQMRMLMPIRPGQGATPFATPQPSGRFTRGATARVAGQECTTWRFDNGQQSGSVCLTADGVMLRASAEGREAAMEAVEVAYGRQDPARFQRPAGMQEMQMPPGMPGGPPPRR